MFLKEIGNTKLVFIFGKSSNSCVLFVKEGIVISD